MKPQSKLILSLSILAAATSCSTTNRDHVYLQDMLPMATYAATPRQENTIRPDDRISIVISCKIPELAVPFNLAPDAGGNSGYLVDPAGNITLPILGEVHAAGLTINQLRQEVARRLIDGGFINDPTVSAHFLNFRYTILGAVNGPGQFAADGDRITILEAIAKAGDLSSEAITDRVAVIREEADGRKMYLHDIKSADLFKSPCFYLQQNDLVYIEPKRIDSHSEQRIWQLTTLGISLASVVTTIIWATK